MDMKTFKQKIKTYLKRKKLKRYELADLAGIPRTCVYRYLSGERGLNLDTAEKIQRVIDR